MATKASWLIWWISWLQIVTSYSGSGTVDSVQYIEYEYGDIWSGIFLRDPPVQDVSDGDNVDFHLNFATHHVLGNWQGTDQNLSFPVTSRRYDESSPSRTLRIDRGSNFSVTVYNDLWGSRGPNTQDLTCPEHEQTKQYHCMNHTNLHLHGLLIDPRNENGDNIWIDIAPGQQHTFDYYLDEDSASGTYWYHPHRHGSTSLQVASGVYGGIIVNDGPPEDDDVARFLEFEEHLMSLSYHFYQLSEYKSLLEEVGANTYEVDQYNRDISQMFNYTGVPWITLTNGLYRPGIEIVEKTYYRWRIVMSPVIFVNVTFFPLWDFGADCSLWIVARDGIYFETPDYIEKGSNSPQLFSSGNRLDVVIYCDFVPSYTDYITNITGATIYGESDYLNAFFLPVFKKCEDGVCDSDRPWNFSLPGKPDYLTQAEKIDYTQLPIRRIAMDFEMRMDGESQHNPNYWWSMNRDNWDPDITLTDEDTGMATAPLPLGSYEVWRLEDWENLGHVWHLHTNHFMVVDYYIANDHDIALGRNWEPLLGRWMDNIMIPLGNDYCHTGNEDQRAINDKKQDYNTSICQPGWVEILVYFYKYTGPRPFHCHFLNHEDHGMMAWVEICDDGDPEHMCTLEADAATTADSETWMKRNKNWFIPVLITLSVMVGILLVYYICKNCTTTDGSTGAKWTKQKKPASDGYLQVDETNA